MSNKKIKYRERVPSPRLVRIGIALFVSIFFWWMLVESVYSTSGRIAAVYPSLVFILGLAVFVYGILSLLYGIRVRISRQWMTDATRQQVLKIRGVIKGDRIDIPCRDIKDVQLASYSVSLWRALLGPLGRARCNEGHMVTLPGYHGTGLAVTYTFENIFNTEAKERTVLFPTRQPEKLQSLLAVACISYKQK
jgi:hypothetical protein